MFFCTSVQLSINRFLAPNTPFFRLLIKVARLDKKRGKGYRPRSEKKKQLAWLFFFFFFNNLS